jgi:hypothetical protein
MTIKEIAELCGVEVHTVRNWINKDNFLKENFTLRNKIKEKLEGGSPERPSDYDLEETLAIIGEGGGNKALASLLAENAENKGALAVRAGNFPVSEAFLMAFIEKTINQAVGEKLAFLSKPDIRKRLSKADRDEEIRQEVAAFVEKHLEFTENWRDVLKECEMYMLFKEECVEKTPIPKYAFHNQLRLDFSQAVSGRDKQDVVIWHNVRFKGAKSFHVKG